MVGGVKFTKPHAAKHADPTAEAIHVNTDVRIAELQAQVQAIPPITVFPDINLPNGISVLIHHGLNRVPAIVWVSPIRSVTPGGIGSPTAGEVAEIRDPAIDRRQTIVLIAGGFGATVVVDVTVF